MFARVTRVASSSDALDQGVEFFARTLLPQIRGLPGFIGAGVLADRATGNAATVTYWADADSMRGSEAAAGEGRDQAARTGGAATLDIHRYDLVVVERVAAATANVFVRSNEVDAAPDKLEQFVQFVRDQVVPTVRSQNGFRALLAGVERETGHCLVSSIWETAADRDASEAAVRAGRREGAQVAGAANVRVERYEVAYLEMKAAGG